MVPRTLEIALTFSEATLDFSDAGPTHAALRIDVAMTCKKLTLITRPGFVVDADGLQLAHSMVKYRRTVEHSSAGRPTLEAFREALPHRQGTRVAIQAALRRTPEGSGRLHRYQAAPAPGQGGIRRARAARRGGR